MEKGKHWKPRMLEWGPEPNPKLRGKDINEWEETAAYFRNLYEKACETASRRLLEKGGLARENQWLKEENRHLRNKVYGIWGDAPSNTFEDVDFIPNDEWEPENDMEKQVKDYFGEQVIGKIGGINYPGYSEEKSIKLFHADMSGHNGLLASLKRILNGRRFYLRIIHSYENQYRQLGFYQSTSSVVYQKQDLYKIRIFLD